MCIITQNAYKSQQQSAIFLFKNTKNEKNEKKQKKYLTKGEGCGNIIGHSREGERQSTLKIEQRNDKLEIILMN